jgi:hypothetical protein
MQITLRRHKHTVSTANNILPIINSKLLTLLRHLNLPSVAVLSILRTATVSSRVNPRSIMSAD